MKQVTEYELMYVIPGTAHEYAAPPCSSVCDHISQERSQ